MYYIALFPDENSTSVVNCDSATANPITMATPSQWPPLFKVYVLYKFWGTVSLYFQKSQCEWGVTSRLYVPPWTFCVWLGESFGAARALDICRVLLELYRLPAISRFGVTILIRINLPLSCIHFFSFIVSRMSAGLPIWNLI